MTIARGSGSNSLTDFNSGGIYEARSISANLADAGVRSALSTKDYFEVTFAGSVSATCTGGGTSGYAGSAQTYMGPQYGAAEPTITGTY